MKKFQFLNLGRGTSNFTATNQLFLQNRRMNLWRFEVIYTFPTRKSSSSLNFITNTPPANGTCSINPFNGSTNTLFTISCPNWFDSNTIKDYLLYCTSLFSLSLLVLID